MVGPDLALIDDRAGDSEDSGTLTEAGADSLLCSDDAKLWTRATIDAC